VTCGGFCLECSVKIIASDDMCDGLKKKLGLI
jgi:hypothetical protein